MAKIDVCEFPTYEEMGKKVAEKALDEILYDGKSIREWMQIIASEDAISRQAVLDALNKTSGIRGDALKALYELPPVTPQQKTEPNRCNQCKYYEGVHNVQGHAPCSFLKCGGVLWNWYCSNYEPYKEEE